ncbi:MAG: 4-hydroxy-tetrahydrodipicolinate synthase [Candidatus Omnitrophica bacterium]|nr:4-hydroxy-tetrahydrodipicolinate synthase [Candidatus Omnitrophota bacterium]MCK5288950.1 4-hydroxy-tetrahydrodipicolinate synthase [Candidatus Omnitrophota bacterium]
MLKGSIVALVTPFENDNEINIEKLKSLIDWHIENSTDGILVCGTTGESATLSHEEHKKIIQIAVEHAKKRIPILAGCGSNSTKEALDLTKFAEKVGADYALIITPYYNKPSQKGLYQHYKTIADSVTIPIIMYNVPSRTGTNLLPDTVLNIYKDCSNIIGVKEASGCLDQITNIMTLVDDNFLLFSGSDETTLPILAVGGVGGISVIANIMPKENHNLIKNFLDGNLIEAKRTQLYLYEMIKCLFIDTNPVPVKTSLSLMGKIELNLRLPLYKMSDTNMKKLSECLKKYNLI